MRNILFAGMLLACALVSAQDVLITQNGDVLNVYDVEVGPNTVFYKSENKATATTFRMSKSDVIMIKRKDGTKFDLGNGAIVQNGDANLSGNSAQQQTAVSAATISEASRKRNEEIINYANTFNPEYVGKDTKKDCDRVMCILGIGEGSQLVNDEIEISAVVGIIGGAFKGGMEKAVSKEGKIIPETGAEFEAPISSSFQNPAFQICIKNKTNKTLYIDLGNTFILRNGEASAYYVPSSTSSNTSSSSGASVNLGAVAGALGVGGALGTLAGGIGVGGGSTSGTVSTTYSQRVIAVPPMSVKKLEAMTLFNHVNSIICSGLYYGFYSSFEYTPNFSFATKKDGNYMNGETHDFSESTSPVKFGFYVSYSDNEMCQNERNVSFNYYLRRMIGFAKTPLYPAYVCSKITKVIPDYDKCTFFVGRVVEGMQKRFDGVFSRGDK